MPTKPKRICSRCQQVVSGPCERCNKQREVQYDKWRGSSRQRGYTAEWDAYSISFRTQRPLCEQCEADGILRESAVVDHIKPAAYFPELFWEPSNHRALCVACNTAKAVADAKTYGARTNA